MYPWFWFWAPNVYFPWSGAVSQQIEPSVRWFYDLIQPGSGNPDIERKAFAIASYGQQLGLLTEVLIDVAEQNRSLSPQAIRSLDRLRGIKASIETLKHSGYEASAVRLAAEVDAVRCRGGEEFVQLSQRLLPLLSSPGEAPQTPGKAAKSARTLRPPAAGDSPE